MIFCDLCKLSFSSHSTWSAHLKGSKHAHLVTVKKERQRSAENSVFVTGFPKGSTETRLKNYFSQFGKIENLILDKNRGVFAIVEFDNKQCATTVLQGNHVLGGVRLVIKQRKTKENGENNRHPVQERICLGHKQIVEQLKKCLSADDQMNLLTDVLKLSDEEVRQRTKICQYFSEIFRTHFTYAEVHLFGSSVNGLGTHGCDIDLLLSLKPECYDSKEHSFATKTNKDCLEAVNYAVRERSRKVEIEELVQLSPLDIVTTLLKYIIRKRAENCSHILVIPSKRCPIVRFKINSSPQLSCDLSIKHRLSVYNSKLIHLYVHSDPRILPLIFTIRYWTKMQQLAVDTSNKITSYATTMLVLFYLQNIEPAVIPSVERLRSLSDFRCVQGGWECSFCNDPSKFPKTNNHQNLTELIKGFFQFFYEFNFKKNVVCLCSGNSLPKGTIKRETPNFKLTDICVQDPFDLSHNITGNLGETLATKVIGAFAATSQLCGKDIWIPSGKELWGISAIFEPLKIRTRLRSPPPRPISPPLDESLAKSCTVTCTVLSSVDVEQIRNSVPGTSKTDDGSNTEWFLLICRAIRSIFADGLRFKCSVLDDSGQQVSVFKIGNKRKSDESVSSSFPSVKRLKSDPEFSDCSSESLEENEDEFSKNGRDGPQAEEFCCSVYYRTWAGRKKARNVMQKPTKFLSIIAMEEMVSEYLIEKSVVNDKEPLYSFKCAVELTEGENKLSQVALTLTPLSDSAELTRSLFVYLQSYIPKLVRQMLSEREVF